MNDMYIKGTVRRISIERRVCMASSGGVCVLSVFRVGGCCLSLGWWVRVVLGSVVPVERRIA